MELAKLVTVDEMSALLLLGLGRIAFVTRELILELLLQKDILLAASSSCNYRGHKHSSGCSEVEFFLRDPIHGVTTVLQQQATEPAGIGYGTAASLQRKHSASASKGKEGEGSRP